MARPRNADGQRTRQAILDAALDLFAEKGYFGTSLRDVATRVGVRESALYNYFGGKDALFDTLLADQEQSRAQRYSPPPTSEFGDVRGLLLHITRATLAAFAEPREQKLFRILMSDGIRLTKSGRLNLHQRMGRDRVTLLMRRLMKERALRRGDATQHALAFLSPLIIWRQLHAIDADLPIIRNPGLFARKHVDQFLQGAGAPAASRRIATRGVHR